MEEEAMRFDEVRPEVAAARWDKKSHTTPLNVGNLAVDSTSDPLAIILVTPCVHVRSQDADSDFEDDFDEQSKVKTDTSPTEARNGKDIQGFPWERLNFTRDKYRETRLKQYKNYESLSRPRQDLEKECLQVEMGKTFYDFHYNTRIVKSTIVHFQVEILCFLLY
ncbi:putative WD repeat-containing protein C2A9.03-like isoform X1 [Prunus yedoensis var. nudiflora]|uniref:Putative WD repeat-containing protein C2A9.03-like isoform X1 n=1 Tax=Prunus yedoensis var. nudiflora TaxID=2094558 RepID=A0A314Z9M6_PRUYE|nr:putative WD repeat-containing protein C2A9.03-like isoform X1 [Prunus yedoensis var. nudiflora]